MLVFKKALGKIYGIDISEWRSELENKKQEKQS